MRNTSARARVDNAHPFRSSDIIDQPPCAILPLFAAASGSFVRSRHRHFSPSRLLVRIGRYFCPAGHCRCTDGLGTRFISFEDRRDRREENNNKRSSRYFSPDFPNIGLGYLRRCFFFNAIFVLGASSIVRILEVSRSSVKRARVYDSVHV